MLWSHDVHCGVLCCHVMCFVVMCCGRVSCAMVWCHVLWFHAVLCSVVGYCATGLAIRLVEWYVGNFGRLGCLMGV